MKISCNFLLLLGLVVSAFEFGGTALRVRVNNPTIEGSRSYTQSIVGNSSLDTVLIEFSTYDGNFVSQLTDFRSGSNMIRILIRGEEELKEPRHQTLCFVSAANSNSANSINSPMDLIPPEAVMKLRQKHPNTIRMAEEDRGEIVQDSPLVLYPSPIRLAAVSSHLTSLCRDAKDTTFSSHHELFNILDGYNNLNGGSSSGIKASTIGRSAVKNYDQLPRCFTVKSYRGTPCICSISVCINWYPCALKYCKNKEGEGEHRCGIKTCRKCLTFRYPVKYKNLCSWDEI